MKFWFERGGWATKRAKKSIALLSPHEVRRIVVVRHAALGDMILLRPFLHETRKFFPAAKITLSVVSNYNYGTPCDLVDEIHIMQGDDMRDTPLRNRIARIKELGEPDILFDFADTARSRYLSFLVHAKLKIGFPYSSLLRNLIYDAAVFRSDFVFEAENMLHALELLGANPSKPLNYAWNETSFQNNSKFEACPRIVYFPFASHGNKSWPKKNFYDLVEKAAQIYPGFQHVLLEGAELTEKLDIYDDLMKNNGNVILKPKATLDEVIGYLKGTALIVSNDTGIRNLGIALGRPTLGVFFKTVPYRYWPREAGHQIVFNSDGSLPTVEQVFAELANLIEVHQKV